MKFIQTPVNYFEMINNLTIPNIRIFIFGTLRAGSKFEYYMAGSNPLGLYYTRGQLMESAVGSAYIDFAETEQRTIGELHHVNYYTLQRIHHLEHASGEFPKGYELDIIPVWPFNPDNDKLSFNEAEQTTALFYKRKGTSKVTSGDWTKRSNVFEEISAYLNNQDKPVYHNDLINHILKYIG